MAKSKTGVPRESEEQQGKLPAGKAKSDVAVSQEQEAEHQHDELLALKEMYEKHRMPVLAGLCVVVAIVVVVPLSRSRREAKIRDAMAALGKAQTAQDLESLVGKYPSTPAGTLAALRLAKTYYNTGSYELALTQYTEFLGRNAGHEMAAAAEMGRIHCIEAMGQTEAALADFAAFAGKDPSHYLVPQAVFGQGRCLEQLNRHEEAKVLYEDFVLRNPESGWLARAEELLENVRRKIERQGRPLPTPPVPTVPAAQTAMPANVLPFDLGPTPAAQPPTNVPLPAVNVQQPATNFQLPTVDVQLPTTNDQTPATNSQQPTADGQ